MPQNLTKEKVSTGATIYEWAVREYEQYQRSRRWYVTAGLIGAALIAFAMFTANYLFALIIVLFGIILYLHDSQAPLEVYFAITETGIILGRKFYRYSELKNFWIIYHPPEVKNLYFGLNSLIKHRLQIPLLDFDPRPIRDYLNQYLAEDLAEEDEPLSDRLARVFKIH